MHRYIKAVGAGAKRARDLTRDEAREALGLIADGQAQPEQIGAFLLALRMKGEGGEELAGFVDALTARMDAGEARAPAGTLDVDCHGDGHEGRVTLLPAAACALAALGVPTLLRLQLDHAQAKHRLVPALAALGFDVAAPLDGPRAARALASVGVAALDLPRYCPPLARLVALRPLFGVRTVAQTLMKLLDPLGAEARAVGVFHAPYLPSTAAALRDRPGRSLCVQALGGLPEATAGKIVRVCRPGGEPETIDLRPLVAAWSGAGPLASGASRGGALVAGSPGAGVHLAGSSRGEALVAGSSGAGAPLGSSSGEPLVAVAFGAGARLSGSSSDEPLVATSFGAGPVAAVLPAAAVDPLDENGAALAGVLGPALRAAAAAALLLHAAWDIAPLAAAEQALAVLRDGRAAAVAARLRDA